MKKNRISLLYLLFYLYHAPVDGQQAPSNPDYSKLACWAAHPFFRNDSDSVPGFLVGSLHDTTADVFFIHPTTFTKNMLAARMNADIEDSALNRETDAKTILNQASVFNGCCRIFAPRYRQAHLKAFLNFDAENSKAAFQLAYQDVRTAFEYYLRHWNHGRPIIIAAHSQGAMHAVKLLQEFFDGKPLQGQLVCAYIVGWQIKYEDFKSIPVCKDAASTGCFVGWRSFKYGEEYEKAVSENGDAICVNPVSWDTAYSEVAAQNHKGSLGKNFSLGCKSCLITAIDPRTKMLWVKSAIPRDNQLSRFKNYHIADYNLFYADIRENAIVRVRSFTDRSSRP